MFTKLECVSIPTDDLEGSIAFYTATGLIEAWRIDRTTVDGTPWALVGMKFSDAASSELVLSNNPDNRRTEVEILVPDVREAFAELSQTAGVTWIREPFVTESGHVAVMQAPDGNIFVLVGR